MKISEINKRLNYGLKGSVDKMKVLLKDVGKVNAIGVEREKHINNKNIRLFVGKNGSNRLVYEIDDKIVSALHITTAMFKKDVGGTITNVYTDKDYRRKGYAKELLKVARKMFKNVRHSEDLTRMGKMFAKGTK